MCFDSSSLIYHLNRTQPYAPLVHRLLDDIRERRKDGFVSVVSELEVLVQPIRHRRRWELQRIRALFDEMHVVELDRAIARRAATIRAEQHLDLPDAVIVATAMSAGCDAIVGNDRRCAQRVTGIPYLLLDQLVKEQTS